MSEVLVISAAFLSMLVIIVFWPCKKQIEAYKCPMCHVGTVEYHIYGSVDQFSDCMKACNECGFNRSGFTEDTF